jgi:hypothetical protein
VPSPRSTRFGSPLVLSRVHWVRPELIAEVKFLTWTEDNLCARSNKPAADVRRDVPLPKAGGAARKQRACAAIERAISRSALPEKKRHVGDMTLLSESRVVGGTCRRAVALGCQTPDTAPGSPDLLEVTGWICADIRAWVVHHSTVSTVLAARP